MTIIKESIHPYLFFLFPCPFCRVSPIDHAWDMIKIRMYVRMYLYMQVLGEGSFGVVREGKYMGREVAVKRARSPIESKKTLESFRCASLKHFHVHQLRVAGRVQRWSSIAVPRGEE